MKKKKLGRKERRKIIEGVIGPVPWDQFEPGIYNYCDRRCEKCSKTERCFLFYDTRGSEPEDIKEGLQIVGESLNQTKQLIDAIVEAEGIEIKITPEDEAEFERVEALADPKDEPICKAGFDLYKEMTDWIASVPSLDLPAYKEEYDNACWHHSLFAVKIARALRSEKEAFLEKGISRKFSLEDAKMSAYVGYRSLLICKKAFEFMDQYVKDFRIGEIISRSGKLLEEVSKHFNL